MSWQRSGTDEKRNLELVFVKYLISNIFSKNLHLKLYWLLQFESRSKSLQQTFTTVPTCDSNRGFPSEALVKVPAQDSIKLSPKLGVYENPSSRLKQGLPKWDFGESFSSKLNQTLPNLHFSNSSNSGLEKSLPKWNVIETSSLRFDFLLLMPGFGYSSKSGLEQKRPKWNLTESLELDHFQNKTLLKGLYLSSLGTQSNNFQVRFGCNSNSGSYNELPSKALVKFPGRGSIKNISQITY